MAKYTSAPVYVSPYQDKIDNLLKTIEKRGPFSYDFNADPIYHQLKNRYQEQGKMAMLDTTAASASLTGGYGNSYASTAGNLAYQDHLRGLNDVIPSLQDSAYNKYTAETNELYNRLSAYQQAEQQAYNKYLDELAYWSSVAKSGGGGGTSGAHYNYTSQKLDPNYSLLDSIASGATNAYMGKGFGDRAGAALLDEYLNAYYSKGAITDSERKKIKQNVIAEGAKAIKENKARKTASSNKR